VLKQAGYQSITASAHTPAWHESESDRLGFNVASLLTVQPASVVAALSASGKESLEDHVRNLPVVSDQSIHIEQIKADLNDRDNVRGDYVLKDQQYRLPNGDLTAPTTSIVSYLANTGSGKPRPGDLQKGTKVNAQAACTQSYTTATAKFDIKRTETPIQTVPLEGFKVQVVDNNGWWSHTLIAQGKTDERGIFEYQKPKCDGNGDGSGPDIYYWIEARIPHESNSQHHAALLVQNTVGVLLKLGTATSWDDSTTNYSTVINWNTPWESNALWMLRYLRLAQEFDVNTGGGKFGVTVFWPGAYVASNSAYAPVSRIVLGSELWKTANPIVHEFGHNQRYFVGNPSRYNGCLGYTVICDPWFASVFYYGHSITEQASNSDSAVNEAWAGFFSEMVHQYFNDENKIQLDGWSHILRGCDTLNKCPYPQENGVLITNGERSEARISTFLWRYTTEILARRDPAKYNEAFTKMKEALKPVNSSDGYAWNVYDFWDRFLKRTFPSSDPPIGFSCTEQMNNQPTQIFSSRPVKDAFYCLVEQVMLDKTKVKLP
jgi:hypothetical protein